MRRIELLLKLQPESERRGRLSRRARAARPVWLALLAVLAMLYARNQTATPQRAAPVAAAPAVQSPASPVARVATPEASSAVAAPPPRRVPRIPSPAKPAPAPSAPPVETRGMLAPNPPSIVIEKRVVRSGSTERTSSEQRSEGQVRILRQSSETAGIEITSELRSLSIMNTGTAPVRIGSVELARMAPDVFAIVGDSCSSYVLAAGAGCRVRIRFFAEDAGAYSGELTVQSDAAPLAVPVKATITIAGPSE